MADLDRTQFAEFILAHGKTICWSGESFEQSQPELLQQLKSLGATITTLQHYNNSPLQSTVDGPHVLILDEDDTMPCWTAPEWCTVFVLPGSKDPMEHKPWRHAENRDHETFLWENDMWKQLNWRGNQATMLKPWNQNADKLFQHQILGVHPEMSKYWDRIHPVYAGASEEHVLHKIPLFESVNMIEKAIGKGKDIIIFSNADEALQPHSIHMAHRIIDAIDYMPKNSWFMLTAALDGEESYINLCNIMGIEPKMHILSGHRFENVTKDSMYMGYPDRSQDFTNHPYWQGREYQIGKRDKKLLCFNRMPRWQRARMVGFLFEHDLVKDSYVSFQVNENTEQFERRQDWIIEDNPRVSDEFRQDPYISNIYKYWEQLPLVLNRTVERDNPVDINDDDLKYFDNSYFSVVNETNFYHCLDGTGGRPISCVHTDGVFISEKVYKPIAHRHPFVVAGINGTLKYLRKAGYKTFAPIINENYDMISNDEERLRALESEILRLASLSDDEWIDMQHRLKPIIDHNYNHFLGIKKLNTTKFNVDYLVG